MKQITVRHNLIKAFFALAALLMTGTGVFSMAAMDHDLGSGVSCVIAAAGHGHCADPVQTGSCIEFHFNLLEQLSHGVADNLGLKLFLFPALLAAGFVLFAAASLFKFLRYKFGIQKVRLRRWRDNAIIVFRESLGYWLTMLEKRDPAYAFVIA